MRTGSSVGWLFVCYSSFRKTILCVLELKWKAKGGGQLLFDSPAVPLHFLPWGFTSILIWEAAVPACHQPVYQCRRLWFSNDRRIWIGYFLGVTQLGWGAQINITSSEAGEEPFIFYQGELLGLLSVRFDRWTSFIFALGTLFKFKFFSVKVFSCIAYVVILHVHMKMHIIISPW